VYDSPGDDTLSTGGHQALYVGAERTVNVLGFDVVAAHGTSGRNRRTPWAASFTTLFNGPWE
jgi:hypothetical protein